ncbi:hypothetical protein BV22DRAFT_1199540 [Leucogyrophana mollusca]|uniref:Uncharacterized protein n=1 Tax=Leucogyrophana mollusca TaxID=85980 RepID=A0ACB8B0X5_9AGAM|nr:hypothetical protein BV22DRAFT_1199540 [Leucogyrophana mollusca]
MALVPTLAGQILEEMDAHTRALVEPPSDGESGAGSVSVSYLGGNRNWVDQGAGSSGMWSNVGGVFGSGSALHPRDFLASTGAHLSDSITTTSSQKSDAGSAVPSTHSAVPSTYSASSSACSSARSHVQLWKDVQMLSMSLPLPPSCTSFTPTHLALLALQRRVSSVSPRRGSSIQASYARTPPSPMRMVKGHRAGRVLDIEALEVPGVPLGWVERVHGAPPALPTFISHSQDDLFDDSDLTHQTSPPRTTPISDATEVRFLTLSW